MSSYNNEYFLIFRVASDERVRFVGNVSLGSDISTQELRNAYDAVVLAYGAAKDRSLGIPGEGSKNVISARNFVGYYNGLPEDINLDFSLDTDHAVIVGLGNVAIDVARVLTTPISMTSLLTHTVAHCRTFYQVFL